MNSVSDIGSTEDQGSKNIVELVDQFILIQVLFKRHFLLRKNALYSHEALKIRVY